LASDPGQVLYRRARPPRGPSGSFALAPSARLIITASYGDDVVHLTAMRVRSAVAAMRACCSRSRSRRSARSVTAAKRLRRDREVGPEQERSGHQAGEEHQGPGPATGKAPAERGHDGAPLDYGCARRSDDPRPVARQGVKRHEKGQVAHQFDPDGPLDQGDNGDNGEDGYRVTTPPDKRCDECHLQGPTSEPRTGPVNIPGNAEDGHGQGDARIGDYRVGVRQS